MTDKKHAFQALIEARYVGVYTRETIKQWRLYFLAEHQFVEYNMDFLREHFENEENFLCVGQESYEFPQFINNLYIL